MDLFNCDFIRVTDSVLEHNGPTSIIKQDQHRGHAGGLSIGYNNISVSPGPVAYVSGCVFRNNTSDPTSDLVQTTSQLAQFARFTGRGGGCAILINPLYSLNATVENCLFEQNYVGSFGGGLYINFNGLEHHIVTIRQVQFLRNQAPTAGGLEVAFYSGGNLGADNRLEVYDSNFTENRAAFGGGVYFSTLGDLFLYALTLHMHAVRNKVNMYVLTIRVGACNVGADVDSEQNLGNFVSFENCTFLRNTAAEFGAAIGVHTLLYFREISNITPFQITSW